MSWFLFAGHPRRQLVLPRPQTPDALTISLLDPLPTMGNTPSSSPRSSQGHLPEISPIQNSKITLVHENTPTLIFRPLTFQEALLEARERFLIPRHHQVELSCQYLTVGHVVLNEANWGTISPNLHTLFVSIKQSPNTPSNLTSPLHSSHLALSPTQPTGSLTSHNHTSELEIPPVPHKTIVEPITIPLITTTSIGRPTSLQPPKRNSQNGTQSSPLRPNSLLPSPSNTSLAISPSKSRPLPLPPLISPSSTIKSTVSSTAGPLVPPPLLSCVTFDVVYSEAGDNSNDATGDRMTFTLPTSTTIMSLKDVLADEFIVPAYLQTLSLNQVAIDTNEESTLKDIGVVDGTVLVVTRS